MLCGTGWTYTPYTGGSSAQPLITDCQALVQLINNRNDTLCNDITLGTCAISVGGAGGFQQLGCQDVFNVAVYVVAIYTDSTNTFTGAMANNTMSGDYIDVNKAVTSTTGQAPQTRLLLHDS